MHTRDASALVCACFRGEVSAWMPEADDLAMQKLAQVAGASAATPLEIELDSPQRDVVHTRTLAGDGARAKILLGFAPEGTAHGCFALCVRGACDDAVRAAILEGQVVSPPPPSTGMRALRWCIHHPEETLGLGLGFFALCALLALVTRPRMKG